MILGVSNLLESNWKKTSECPKWRREKLIGLTNSKKIDQKVSQKSFYNSRYVVAQGAGMKNESNFECH